MKRMNILLVSGSSRENSTNTKLLQHLSDLKTATKIAFQLTDLPQQLPLFSAKLDANPLPEKVAQWRNQLSKVDGVIICTPEYIKNVPAAIINALDWITSSGELSGKKVIAMTLTPAPPRGESAMKSLTESLKALNANVLVSAPLYLLEFNYSAKNKLEGSGVDTLEECLSLLLSA